MVHIGTVLFLSGKLVEMARRFFFCLFMVSPDLLGSEMQNFFCVFL